MKHYCAKPLAQLPKHCRTIQSVAAMEQPQECALHMIIAQCNAYARARLAFYLIAGQLAVSKKPPSVEAMTHDDDSQRRRSILGSRHF